MRKFTLLLSLLFVMVTTAMAQVIDDFYGAETTFTTYSGDISHIIDGNTTNKWWSYEGQNLGETITITLNNSHNVGQIKCYFCNDDKPAGVTIERRATADGEWITIADFTEGDIVNNIFQCDANGEPIKELQLRITQATTKWLQIAEVELYDYISTEREISIEASGEGTVAIEGVEGTSVVTTNPVTLVGTPKEGYYLSCWKVNDEIVGRGREIVDNSKGNKKYIAVFEKLPEWTNKLYYLKLKSDKNYLTVVKKNVMNEEQSFQTTEKQRHNKDQIFKFESDGYGGYYLKSSSGYYLNCSSWNAYAQNTGGTTPLTVSKPDVDGYISLYQTTSTHVGYLNIQANHNNGLYCDGGDVSDATLWILEEYPPLSVYMIKSAHTGYATGSAIYYNTTEGWQWETADRWNKEMWMVIEGHAEEAVPTVDSYDATGTHLRICDYSTGELMRDKSVQIVKIDGWDGAYNLQYSTTTNDAVQHAREYNTDLVGWNPATTTDCQASAWSIEYLGLSTDLHKLTDEQLTAMSALEAAYKVGVLFKGAVNGTGLGEFHGGDAVAMNAALTVAEEILAKSIAEIAELDAEAIANINAATATITSESARLELNQPQAGRYYRIKGGNSENSLPHYYITGSTNWDDGRIALASEPVASTIYYLDENNHLLSYTAGLYLGVNISSNNNFKFEAVDTPEENIADITFEASTTKVGLYTIKSADAYLRYKIHEGAVELDKTASISSPEDNWIIEEVESIPVNVSGIGWASLYTPAPLTIPADIEAYYISGFEGAVATLKKIETTIPANTAVILKATKEITIRATYNFAIADDVEAITDNKLEGTVAKETKNTDAYILSAGPNGNAIGLYPLDTNTGTAPGGSFINGIHKAYLPVSNAPVAGSNGFSFRFEDGMTTGIDNVNRESDNVETIYDLTGRRVEAITAPGIYIVNGNKVLVK